VLKRHENVLAVFEDFVELNDVRLTRDHF
jgi:hypothetical protein